MNQVNTESRTDRTTRHGIAKSPDIGLDMVDPVEKSHAEARKPRRRSMLPQLQSRTSTRVSSPTKEDSSEAPLTTSNLAPKDETISSTGISKDANDKRSMPPPRQRQSRASSAQVTTSSKPSKGPTTRKPSSSRTSAATADLGAPRQRAASNTRAPPLTARHPSHARSTSYQAAPSSVPTQTPSSSRRESLRYQKPTFNTFQQHYSPLKSTSFSSSSRLKPPIPTHKPASVSAPPSTPTDSDTPTAPAITQAQSTELLQLHRLHSLAEPTLTAWSRSAESHYRNRFSDLGARTAELHAIASEQQGLLNALALVEWGAGIPSAVIGEKVEVLSRDVGELEGMVAAEEGKFERVRLVWETWFDQVERMREVREEKVGGGGLEGRYVEGIGDGWKAEAMVLERELGYVRKDLEAFGDVKEGSGLGKIVRLGTRLCQGLLEELDVMQWIEGEVMREESVWVDEMVGRLGKGLSDGVVI